MVDHNPKRRIVVVLGMDRCGTSLLASVMQGLGVWLGEDLNPGNWSNERGHFESLTIYHLHERLLAALQLTWSTPSFERPLRGAWWRHPDLMPIKQELSAALQGYLAQGGLFGFKDPRTIRFLPLWSDIFEESRLEPVYVMAFRHPGAVASSLAARDGMDPIRAELLWLERYVDGLIYTEGRIAAFVDYDDWFDDPEGTAARLIAAVGLPWEGDANELGAAITELVAPQLRHHQAPMDQITFPLSSALFAALKSADRAELTALAKTGRAALDLCGYALEQRRRDLERPLAEARRRIEELELALASKPPAAG